MEDEASSHIGTGDVERVVRAILEGIARGELSASEQEQRFLRSIVELLATDTSGQRGYAASSPR